MVLSGFSHSHHRLLSCSLSAMTLLLAGRGCALSWPHRWPESAAREAKTGRRDDVHWPSSCFLSVVHGATMRRPWGDDRPLSYPVLTAALLMDGRSDAIHRTSRCHPSAVAILSLGLALGQCRKRPCPYAGRPRLAH